MTFTYLTGAIIFLQLDVVVCKVSATATPVGHIFNKYRFCRLEASALSGGPLQ